VLKQSAFVSLVTMSQCQETREENDADICNIVMHHLTRPLGMFLIECSFCYTVRNTKRSCDDSSLEIFKAVDDSFAEYFTFSLWPELTNLISWFFKG
jgi:hypothetical protein